MTIRLLQRIRRRVRSPLLQEELYIYTFAVQGRINVQARTEEEAREKASEGLYEAEESAPYPLALELGELIGKEPI